MTILITMAALLCALIPLAWVWGYRNSFFKEFWVPSAASAILFFICAIFLIAVGIERFVL